jgi:hypothetical protein
MALPNRIVYVFNEPFSELTFPVCSPGKSQGKTDRINLTTY